MPNKLTKYLCHSQFQGNELYHHGILGMHWGEKNGPPYPLNSEGHRKKIDQLVNELNKDWGYGVLVNGRKITNLDGFNFERDYKTTPVGILAKEKIGLCWDFVNYQHSVLNKAGIDNKNYMFVCKHGPRKDDIATHTFTLADIGGKKYWIESAFWKNRGVHEVSDFRDVTKKLRADYGTNADYDVYEFNPDGMDRGLTDSQYFSKATNKDNLVYTTQDRFEYKKIK